MSWSLLGNNPNISTTPTTNINPPTLTDPYRIGAGSQLPSNAPAPQTQVNPNLNAINSTLNQFTQATNNYAAQAPALQANVQAGQQSLQQSAYPSYPNSAGAGSQSAGQPTLLGTGQAGGGYGSPSTGGTYSLNPWSLTGEAMTRS